MLIYLQSIEEYLEDYDRRLNKILNEYKCSENFKINDDKNDLETNLEKNLCNIDRLFKILDVLL